MGAVGFQDYWVVGGRLYVQRDDVAGVEQPFIDFGTMKTVTPNFEIEKIELEDSDGGTKNTVDEKVTKLTETYDVTCANFNSDNLSTLFLADAASAFTQTAVEQILSQYAHVGRLVKIKDSSGDNVYALDQITGVFSANPVDGAAFTTAALVSVTAATKTIVVTGDVTSDLGDGDSFVLLDTGEDLNNKKNARTYTVNGTPVFSSPNTTIVVDQTPVADETTTNAEIIYVAAGDTGTLYEQDVDWDIVSLDRGILRMIDGGAFSVDGNLFFVTQTTAISGNRLVLPQTSGGEVKGQATLILGRDGNENQTAREFRVSITPSSVNFTVDDFSDFVLTVTVLQDASNEMEPAGRLLHFKGTLPNKS